MPLPERKLPDFILKESYRKEYEQNKNAIGEEFDVQRKFSTKTARFAEKNIDQVAFGYMSPESVLFWLPRFIGYLMDIKQRNISSNHFGFFLYRLADKDFVQPLRALTAQDECNMVLRYIDWYESGLIPLDFDTFAEDITQSRKLWSQPLSE